MGGGAIMGLRVRVQVIKTCQHYERKAAGKIDPRAPVARCVALLNRIECCC